MLCVFFSSHLLSVRGLYTKCAWTARTLWIFRSVCVYTKKFLYYLKGVMNFQIPKSVICIKSDRFLAVLYLMPCNFTGTGYLVIACGSLTSSGTYVKIKVRGSNLYRQRNYIMLCVFFSSQLSSVRGR